MSALALVNLGNLQLALPYPAVDSIEHLRDLRTDHSDNPTYWQLQRGNQHWSVFSLDTHLYPQRQLDSNHTLALCFKQFPGAITCSAVESIRCENPTSVPALMRRPSSCLRGFILHNDQLALLVDPDQLIQRMSHFLTLAGATA